MLKPLLVAFSVGMVLTTTIMPCLAQSSQPLDPGFYSWQDPSVRLNLKKPGAKDMNWSQPIQNELRQFWAQDLKGKVAVFDADRTLWKDDVGEAFLKWLIKHEKLVNLPEGLDPYAHYEALCAQDKMVGYPYAAQLMAGLSEAEVRRLSATFFAEHFRQNVYPAQQVLIQKLQEAGVDVWIVSASNQWLIEAAANYLGVPASRVVGIRLEVKDARLTEQIIQPITFRAGKVAAIKKYIGQQPVLVAGDSMTDYEMLQYASGLRILINPRDKGVDNANIYKLATKQGWLIQNWD